MSDIWRYTAEQWSEERADGYYQGIADALADLAAGNSIGIPVDVRPGVQKCLFNSHAIYFRVSGQTIQILRILHQAMDARRHLT